jgi:hypothetical protein
MKRGPRIPHWKATFGLLALLCPGQSFQLRAEQTYSDWTQATGIKHIEYRWRQNDAKGCDVEYRTVDANDKKKYKSRIVFQIDGDEHEKPYTIVSFADPAPHLDQVPVCTQVTDVSVTRF